MPAGLQQKITKLVEARFEEEVAFLRELVRVPTDTPPGDNTPHAERTAALLEAMGYTVERHPDRCFRRRMPDLRVVHAVREPESCVRHFIRNSTEIHCGIHSVNFVLADVALEQWLAGFVSFFSEKEF